METNSHNQGCDRLQPAPKQRNYDDLEPLLVEYKSKDTSAESPFTIINTPGCGKRVTLAPTVIENICSPTHIQTTINADGIGIRGALQDGGTPFVLRKAGKKPCVYSSHLVDTLTARFNLNFDGRTSISFHDVEYLTKDGVPMAFVQLRQTEQGTDAVPMSAELESDPEPSSTEQETDFPDAPSPHAATSSNDEFGSPQEAFEE